MATKFGRNFNALRIYPVSQKDQKAHPALDAIGSCSKVLTEKYQQGRKPEELEQLRPNVN